MSREILIAGFGGQGVLFSGKFLANIGLLNNQEVSWLPSYGPEMRGGTANCGVILSPDTIGCPVVSRPDVLIALNLPSLDKFENAVKPSGHIFTDSSMISKKVKRTDVIVHNIPAAKMAEDNALSGLGSMIMAGGVISLLDGISDDLIESAMRKTVPKRKQALFDSNMKAVYIGQNAV
ncbi:MAG: 2-oxoacid:acceptor oxidoreductase family protein [Oscillospiraceae bacterium]|nr:2-oxoacid:acceptor oxidoreductase family protein [Oscillospiraceae bacterium]